MNPPMQSYSSAVFQRAGLPLPQIQHWNNYQLKSRKQGFQIIEFENNKAEKSIWMCLLESEASDNKHENQFDGDDFNAQLIQQFVDRDSYSNTYWNSFGRDFIWSGFYIPVEDFTYFTSGELEAEIQHAHLLSQFFDVNEYLNNLKKESISSEFKAVPIALLGLWKFITFYKKFLQDCFEKESIQEKPIALWYTRHIKAKSFHKKMPSDQLSVLLLAHIEHNYFEGYGRKYLDILLSRSHPRVKDFFEKYDQTFVEWYLDETVHLLVPEMKNDFFECCKLDFKIIAAAEVMQYDRIAQMDNEYFDELKKKAFPRQTTTIIEDIREAIKSISVNSLLWDLRTNFPTEPKRYFPKGEDIFQSYVFDISKMDEDFIDEIDMLLAEFSEKDVNAIEKKINASWQKHLMNVCNQITLPGIVWAYHFDQALPQWNLPSNQDAEKYQKAYFKKQESLSKQKKRFEKLKRELQRMMTTEEIEKMTSEAEPFFDDILAEQWKLTVGQHIKLVEGNRAYRQRRMTELGIDDQQDSMDYRNEIWLDEMLEVEEEIKKYIPFVKKAFKAALPTRRTIEFNDRRHSKSGVEFDPSTVNDQNKWLRGDVMKTIKTNTKFDEIEQINTFCLDFSGSMKHARMRNLFKILYLLVMGLEDRRSYDAFHFFNTNFIEGANFSENYTSRTLLFKILSVISEIRNGEVFYRGMLGTNISGGVAECHERMQTFKSEIEDKKPGAKFLCSLIVITDGRPNVGITDFSELAAFIDQHRQDGNVAIKGIYIKDKEEKIKTLKSTKTTKTTNPKKAKKSKKEEDQNFMESIFGKDEFVETVEFDEAVNKFTSIISRTYRDQRQSFKWEKKRESIQNHAQRNDG